MTAPKRIAVVGTIVNALIDFRSDLIVDMVAAGHQVYAFASDYTETSENAIRKLGATPVRYRISRSSLNPLADLKVIWQLYWLFRNLKIDVSFCYFVKPVIYGNIAAFLARVPTRAVKIEGLGWVFTNPPEGINLKRKLIRAVQTFLYKVSLPRAHHVFLLNKDDKADLLDAHHIQVRNLTILDGIGVNLKSFSHCCQYPKKLRFVFVGRLLQEKGIRYFIDAAVDLKRRYPHIEFLVLGEPDDARGSITRAELNLHAENGVLIYPGRVKNIAHWLKDTSVFVLPSYYREGVPRSTQEAMAIGRAVITTDGPGCKETVEDGVNGFLIPQHDSQALINAMLKFIKHPELVKQMGLNSRRIAERRFDAGKTNTIILQQLLLNDSELHPEVAEHISSI